MADELIRRIGGQNTAASIRTNNAQGPVRRPQSTDKAAPSQSSQYQPSAKPVSSQTAPVKGFEAELDDSIAAALNKTLSVAQEIKQIPRPDPLMQALPPEGLNEPRTQEVIKAMAKIDERIDGIEQDIHSLRLRLGTALEDFS